MVKAVWGGRGAIILFSLLLYIPEVFQYEKLIIFKNECDPGMGEGGRNADFMFPGMADKINKALQLREIICKSVFERVSSSIFAKGLCSRRQLYGHFHIKKAHCLTKQEKPGEFSSVLPAFPG